jgi:hypothetical protein
VKKEKFLGKLKGWSQGSLVDRKACLSLVGSLNHCAVLIKGSRTHLPSFYRLAARFDKAKSDFIKLKLPQEVAEDASWWRDALSAEWCGLHLKAHPPELSDPFFVDASTSWGVGLVHKGRWLAWPLRMGWRAEGREIGWAEFVALEMAVLTAIQCGIRNSSIVVRSDNQGVVSAFAAEFSRGPAQNTVLRRILLTLNEFDLWLRVTWIPTADNPADGPSRGQFPPWSRLLSTPPKVPLLLRPLLGNSVVAPPRNNR